LILSTLLFGFFNLLGLLCAGLIAALGVAVFVGGIRELVNSERARSRPSLERESSAMPPDPKSVVIGQGQKSPEATNQIVAGDESERFLKEKKGSASDLQ
jgi:hypothetical protein